MTALEPHVDTPGWIWVHRPGVEPRSFPLCRGSQVVGRGPGVALVVEDGAVSRRHVELRVEGGEVELRELNSKNGVFVGGERVEGPLSLRHGDRFSIGEVELVLEHPGSRIDAALARAGERTAVLPRAPKAPAPMGAPPRLVGPALAAVGFGLLILLLIEWG